MMMMMGGITAGWRVLFGGRVSEGREAFKIPNYQDWNMVHTNQAFGMYRILCPKGL
jgi:hypothetical protein